MPLPIARFGLVPFLGGLTRSSDHERTDFQAPAVEVRPLSATLASLDITLAKCPTASFLSTYVAALEGTGFRSWGSSARIFPHFSLTFICHCNIFLISLYGTSPRLHSQQGRSFPDGSDFTLFFYLYRTDRNRKAHWQML